MKVGDKVVCIASPTQYILDMYKSQNITFPVKNGHYTIREVLDGTDGTYVRLEEIINPKYLYKEGYGEARFHIKAFRKIDTRPELSELTDEMILTAPTTKELQTA